MSSLEQVVPQGPGSYMPMASPWHLITDRVDSSTHFLMRGKSQGADGEVSCVIYKSLKLLQKSVQAWLTENRLRGSGI